MSYLHALLTRFQAFCDRDRERRVLEEEACARVMAENAEYVAGLEKFAEVRDAARDG